VTGVQTCALPISYNFRSFYAHLSQVSVVSGQVLRKGDAIAMSGNSGLSTGPHLHYEVHYEDRPLDPAPFVQTAAEPSRLFQKTRSVPWASLVAYQQP
jgi:murein DD-endopeptidase MepM/ murein hydrolase activator NlpD